MTITWWLYYGREPIASVLADEHASIEQVRARAIGQHDRIPLCYPTAPCEHRQKLVHAQVVRS